MECVRDQELEWMTSKGTAMSALRGPLLLPLGYCQMGRWEGGKESSRIEGDAAAKGEVG